MSIKRRLFKRSAPAFSDEELLRQYREGKAAALGTLFQRYSHKVLGSCISYLKNQQEGEDAAMEIFEHLCRNINQYDIANFGPWLFYVTRNHCLKKLRHKLRLHEEDFSKINPDMIMEIDGSEGPYSEEKLERLSNAIDQLKEDQRRCIILFFLEQRSYREIAETTEYTLNQVKSHIQNGKRNLKNSLETV